MGSLHRHGTRSLQWVLVCSLVVPFVEHFLPEFQFAPAQSFYTHVQSQTETLWTSNDIGQSGPGSSFSPTQPRKHPILWIWLSGFVVAAVVVAGGLVRILWLMWRSTPAGDPRWISAAAEISHRLRLKRRFLLLQNDLAVLGTWGFVRPRVFIPR